MTRLEIEVKFFIEDLTAVRARLLAAGATVHKPRVYEHNVRLDTPDERLRQAFSLIRVRRDKSNRITFKGPAPDDYESEAKVREELEIEVSDFNTAVAILERLGFVPQQVYEKYRETFYLGEVEVVLDEMPYGNFIELEGEEAAIKAAAAQVGLDWQQRIVDNYLSLMAQLKTRYNLPFDDLTFANFEAYPVSVADLL